MKNQAMLKKSLKDLNSFSAGDDTILKEVLHPKNDGINMGFSLAYAQLESGTSSLAHILHQSSETYIIQEGQGIAFIDGKEVPMEIGDTLYIPAGAEQYIKNTGDGMLSFWCVVMPPWSEEEEEVL